MTDQASTPAEGQESAATESEEGQEPKGKESKTFDADYVTALRNENAQWRNKAKQAEERAQEFEDSQKSELEKAQAKATRAEQKAAEAESKLLRYEIATEKQVPADALDLLVGNTREELEAKADKLLELVKNRTDTDTKPDFDGGPREPAPEPKSPEQQINEISLGLLGVPSP